MSGEDSIAQHRGELPTSGACLALVLALLAASPGVSRAAPANTLNIVIIHAHPRLLPLDQDFDTGLSDVLSNAEAPVAIFEEYLDVRRFGGNEIEADFVGLLRHKYAERRPSVIVAVGFEALWFLLTHRQDLFPDVSIVHAGLFDFQFRKFRDLPANVVGVPIRDAYLPTMECALRLHPRASRLVIVTGASASDREQETILRQEAAQLEGRIGIEYLAGLPMDTLRDRLAALDPGSIVFTVGFFRDGAGIQVLPRESVRIMAAAAGAPVYAPDDSFLGTGVVGGYMPDWTAAGRQAAELVLAATISGADAAGPSAPLAFLPVTLHLDWRQAVRWEITGAIPRDAVVHFRERTFLEQHRELTVAAAIAFLLQSFLVTILLVERRRRRAGERTLHQQQVQLAHVSRVAVAGELSGSLAHQLNQPLGAILANAEAAELLIDSGAAPLEQLKGILADIRKDDLRARDVIQRLRRLLARQDASLGSLDLREALHEAQAVLAPEARRRRVTFAFEPAPAPILVRGDRLLIEQVVVNLVLNAMEAVADLPEDRRRVALSAFREGDVAVVVVADRGPGITADHLPHVFESFFTTKPRGLGLGLSIARTLIESMDGTIAVESEKDAGATFRVRLPVLTPEHAVEERVG